MASIPQSTMDKFRALVRAQANARKTVRDATRRAVRGRTRQMRDADWRDYREVTTYARDSKRIVNTYQRQLVALTNAYHARQLSLVADTTATPVAQVGVEDLRGIPDESTYGRIADYYRYLRDNPDRLESAVDAYNLAIDRSEDAAMVDLLLAYREQEHQFLNSKKTVTGWRYVIHPELSESKTSCGLCIAASQRVYSVKRRRPIHAHCNCEAVPTGEFPDYGLELNDDDLARLYEDAGGTTSRRALVNTRYSIREHGELGPVLTYSGQRFRGPRQVHKDSTHGKELPDL